jgi:hypothetical protein
LAYKYTGEGYKLTRKLHAILLTKETEYSNDTVIDGLNFWDFTALGSAHDSTLRTRAVAPDWLLVALLVHLSIHDLSPRLKKCVTG